MTTTNPTILACVDGSLHMESVCTHAAWASRRLNAPVQALHIQSPGSSYATPTDLSGTLGVRTRRILLEKLTDVDEARGKLDQQ